MTHAEIKSEIEAQRSNRNTLRTRQKADNKREWGVLALLRKTNATEYVRQYATYAQRNQSVEAEVAAISTLLDSLNATLAATPKEMPQSSGDSWNGKNIAAMSTAHICNAIELNMRFAKSNENERVARKAAAQSLLAELIERITTMDATIEAQ